MARQPIPSAAPNTRMQRTRSSPSALRSPLMRNPLGARSLAVAGAALLAVACGGPGVARFEEPTTIARLELHDRLNQVLWRLDAVPPVRVSQIDYGIVPIGFRQTVPEGGRPRALTNGEPLLLIYSMPEGWVRHRGEAKGSDGFRGGFWLAGPWPGTTPAEVFVEGLHTIDHLREPKTHPAGAS